MKHNKIYHITDSDSHTGVSHHFHCTLYLEMLGSRLWLYSTSLSLHYNAELYALTGELRMVCQSQATLLSSRSQP